MSGAAVLGRAASVEKCIQNLKSALPILKENGIVGLIEPISSVEGYFLQDFTIGT